VIPDIHHDENGDPVRVELDKKTGLYYRPDMGELFVIREQTQYKTLDFKGRTVMDVGANIGSFVHLAKENGAKAIWAYEPMPSTYRMLRVNCAKYLDVSEKNQALIGGTKRKVDFYLSKRFPAAHTIIPVRGRKHVSVKASNFWDALLEVKPDIVKIDVEGGEYSFMFENSGPAFSLDAMPDFVEQVAIELHMRNEKQIKLAKEVAHLFDEWWCHRKFRFNWHITTLVLHRTKESELGTVENYLALLGKEL